MACYKRKIIANDLLPNQHQPPLQQKIIRGVKTCTVYDDTTIIIRPTMKPTAATKNVVRRPYRSVKHCARNAPKTFFTEEKNTDEYVNWHVEMLIHLQFPKTRDTISTY